MSTTWRRSPPYKTKPMNLVIRSVGGVVVQGKGWDSGGTRYVERDGLGGKAILISRKNTYACRTLSRREIYELTANVTTVDEWNVNVS